MGSAKAQAFQRELDKILEKVALEMVDFLYPGYYSCLFLVQKVSVGWHPVIDLLIQNGYVILIKFQGGDDLFSVGIDQEGGLHVLDLPQGHLYLDS